MIWFTLDKNFEQLKPNRFVLVYYESAPHIQRIMRVIKPRVEGQHPIIGTDLEIDPATMGYIDVPSDHGAWTSTIAVTDDFDDISFLLDQAMCFSDVFKSEIEEARLRMLASIRLFCT
jgi:hypothetical protein